MSNPKFAIIGVGGVGGYYGAKLLAGGFDVHFLLRSDYEFVKANGLRVDSIDGDMFTASPNIYADAAVMPKCDYVIISLKTTSNWALSEILPQICDENTTVLLFQNGIGVEGKIAQYCNPEKIYGGICFICSTKIGAGHIDHCDYGKVNLAKFSPKSCAEGITDEMNTLAAIFTKSKIENQLSEDLLLARWMKLVWNIPFNGLSVLLSCKTNEMLDCEFTAKLIFDLMKEVQVGAAAQGRVIGDEFIENMIEHTKKMVPYKPSMMLDYEAKRPLEIEAIYENLISIANSSGAVLPKIEMLCAELKFLNSRNLAQ